MQVRKTPVHQRPDKIDRQPGALVTAQKQCRVGSPLVGIKCRTVHQIAAISGQSDALARFRVGRSRFGALAAKPAARITRWRAPCTSTRLI
jgi:hypothetical protein